MRSAAANWNVLAATAAIACCAGAVRALQAKEDRSRQAENSREFMIEGVPRMEVQGDKPPYAANLDPTQPVGDYLARQLNAQASSVKILVNLPNYLPARVASELVATPWRRHVAEPPILDILIKHPKDIQVASWRLVITDDHGRIFRMIRGQGRFPDRLTWDGKGDSGAWLQVGHPYAYSYFVLDQAQVPTYLPGKTVLVRGLLDESASRKTLSLDAPSLFDGAAGISAAGRALLREAQDRLRRWGNKTLHVEVYGEDPPAAQRQAEAVRRHLIGALYLEDDAVLARGHPLEESRYGRVDIWAR